MSYLPDMPPNKAFNSPTRSSPRELPDATEAPVQFSKITVHSSAWEKLPPVERPPPSGTRQTPKNAVRGSNMFLQRPQPNPKISQDLPFENLNAEEPASPAPSIPNPELCYIRLIAVSVPLSKWGLHAPSTKEGSQHAPTGASHKNAAAQAPYSLALQLRKMAELLRPCVKLSFTRAPPPPEPGRQHRLRPVALSSRAFSDKCPKTLRGHHRKPQTRPFNSEAHGLTMSYLPDMPANKAFNSPTRSSPRGLPDATEAPVQFSKITVHSSAWEKLPTV